MIIIQLRSFILNNKILLFDMEKQDFCNFLI